MALSVDIKKDFGSFRLEAAFEAGDCIHGLLGASGCGKSMTLKCIAGVVRPDEGRIVLDGRVLFDSAARIDLPPQRRKVGLLFQNYALFPNMTVEQNLMAPCTGRRTGRPPGRGAPTWCTAWRWRDWKGTGPPNSPAASSSGWPWPAS